MSVQTQPRAQQRQTPTRFWHICRAHPNFGDQPCTPSCRALCGRPMPATSDGNGKHLSDIRADACVVCRRWSRAELAGRLDQ